MTQLPLVCNLGALTPAQRARRAELAARVGARVERIEESPDGYRLRLGHEGLAEAEELLALERRCCSVLTLELGADESGQGVTLTIGGPEGAKAFIAAELGDLVSR